MQSPLNKESKRRRTNHKGTDTCKRNSAAKNKLQDPASRKRQTEDGILEWARQKSLQSCLKLDSPKFLAVDRYNSQMLYSGLNRKKLCPKKLIMLTKMPNDKIKLKIQKFDITVHCTNRNKFEKSISNFYLKCLKARCLLMKLFSFWNMGNEKHYTLLFNGKIKYDCKRI